MNTRTHLITLFLSLSLLSGLLLIGCTAVNPNDSDTPISTAAQVESSSTEVCTVTEPVWLQPPEDTAVQGSPEYGHYFANEDRSILASAWWVPEDKYHIHAGEDGVKVGWFRPAGETLEISGQRIDAKAPPLEASIPCCYPTRFQATGLIFPTEGCWEVTATAAEAELSFVVWVEP